MAQINDISIYKGEDITITLTVVKTDNNGDVIIPIQSVPITGWTVKFTVRKHFTDVAPLIQLPTVIAVGTDGVTTVTIPSIDTVALPAKPDISAIGVGEYHYDVTRTDPGSRAVLSIGKLTILQEVYTP